MLKKIPFILMASQTINASCLVFVKESMAREIQPSVKKESVQKNGDLKEVPKLFSAGLSYSIQTDFADQLRPRLYRHTLDFHGSRKEVGDLFLLKGALGVYWRSLDNKISGYKEDFGISYANFGVLKNFKKKVNFMGLKDNAITMGVEGSLPISKDSRLAGYRGAISGRVTVTSPFFNKKLSVTNTLTGRAIFNKYDYSPIDGGAVPRANYGWKLGASIPVGGNFSVGVGLGIKRTYYSDSFQDFIYNNSQYISYSYKKLSFSLSYINGGYTDDGKVDFWFVDRYRRIVTATMSYNF